MKICKISLTDTLGYFEPCAACIGFFDGVHKGHQALIAHTVEAAEKKHLEPACITFHPDPWVVLKGLSDIPHLTSLERRYRLMEHFGIRTVYQIQFTKELADLSPEEFVEKILLPLNVRHLVCGFDYTYGKFGAGKPADLLKDSRFTAEVVDAVEYGYAKISSTRIENVIRNGHMEIAEVLLGYPYVLEGTVIEGRKKGRAIGFPTANLQFDEAFVLPAPGVYAGECSIRNATYRVMINVGHNSSFNYYEQLHVEAHIIGFKEDLYGKRLEISVRKKVRDEMNFHNPAELRDQLEKDRRTISNYSFLSGINM